MKTCASSKLALSNRELDWLQVSGVDSNDEIYRGVQEPMKKWLVSFDAITVCPACFVQSFCAVACAVWSLPANAAAEAACKRLGAAKASA